jgi:hypothetical protein
MRFDDDGSHEDGGRGRRGYPKLVASEGDLLFMKGFTFSGLLG